MTCVITIFINVRLRLSGQKYLGDFDDFTPSWFKSIGYSLGLTLLLKIFAVIISAITKITWPALNRCYDRGCSFWNKTVNKNKTKKKTQDDLERLYIDPDFDIDFGYTEVINVVFVAFTLAPLIPYIFYIALVFLVIFYWREKLLSRLFSPSADLCEGPSSVRRKDVEQLQVDPDDGDPCVSRYVHLGDG